MIDTQEMDVLILIPVFIHDFLCIHPFNDGNQRGWHENQEEPAPFIKYLLRTILAAYRDFEERVDLVREKLPAVEIVRRAVYGKIGKFTKSDAE